MTEKKTRTRKPKDAEVICANEQTLKNLGFDFDWLQEMAAQYGFTKFEYVHKFYAFRCYRGDTHVEWTSINEQALLHGKNKLITIRNQHQPVSKSRQIINRPWS